MLNVSNILGSNIQTEPFKHAVIENLLDLNYSKELLANLPQEGNYRSLREGGNDKVYNVVNNILLELGKPLHNTNNYLPVCWIKLIEELQGKPYRESLSDTLKEDFINCYMEITLKRYGYNDYISAHTDKECVRATHMIFLNNEWDLTWGGLLHFLNNDQNDVKTFLPTRHNSVVFMRSTVSWHRVCPVITQGKERIALQVAFWNTVDRTVLPGRQVYAV